MKKFLQRLFGFSLGPILGALLAFIQVPIVTHFLSLTEYGKAELFQTLLLQLPNFIYIGMDQAFTREYHQAKDKRNLIQNAILLPMLVGLGVVALFIVFSQQLSNYLFESPAYSYIVWYTAVWLLSAIIERFLLLAIRMEERAKEFSFYNLLLKILIFVVTLGLIWAEVRDFRAIVYGLIFGQLLGDFILFVRYRQYFDFSQFNYDQPLVKQMFIFGLPLMVATSLTSALQAVDNIFIDAYSTKADIAIYGAARKVANLLGIMKTAFASFWVPTAYRWYEEQKSMKHYKFISDSLLLVLTAIFFGILVFKSLLVQILSADYYEAQYIMGLLCFPHIMYTLSETTTLGISFSRRTHYNILVSLATFVPSILMNLLLTPSLGYRGAALASSISYVMFYLARTYFSSRTGFYFGQGKQLLATLLMMGAALLNMTANVYVLSATIALGLVTLLIQGTTFKTGLAIYRSPDDWDFN